MITGSNTNVRYRGKVFHVQTEDSGRDHPHIISHVYHGGTILASEKSEYGGSVDGPNLDALVKKLIGKQHRSMVERLKSGAFDDTIAERLEGGAAKNAAQAAPAAKAPPAAKVGPAVKPSGKSIAAKMRGRGAVPARARRAPAPAAAPPRREGAEKSAVANAKKRDVAPGISDEVLSQRPLDEVILDYLVEKSRNSRSKG